MNRLPKKMIHKHTKKTIITKQNKNIPAIVIKIKKRTCKYKDRKKQSMNWIQDNDHYICTKRSCIVNSLQTYVLQNFKKRHDIQILVSEETIFEFDT